MTRLERVGYVLRTVSALGLVRTHGPYWSRAALLRAVPELAPHAVRLDDLTVMVGPEIVFAGTWEALRDAPLPLLAQMPRCRRR